MHRFEEERVVVLPLAVKSQAENYNESTTRKRMDRLNAYPALSMLKYDALLYLAHHME